MGIATSMGEAAQAAEAAGAGAVAAVLTPVLAATAAAIFLLVGYILSVLDPRQAFARTMLRPCTSLSAGHAGSTGSERHQRHLPP